MARRVFYSFHWDRDKERAAQVRNIGMIEGNRPASDNEWEAVKRGGDAAIQAWIKAQLDGKSCCVVLIGQETAGRKWITYEISEAWNQGKGVVGVYVHNLKDLAQHQSWKGANPIDHVTFTGTGRRLSEVVKAYDPPYSESRFVYADIAANLADWIDEAVRIRSTA